MAGGKHLIYAVALSAVLALSATACSSSASSGGSPNGSSQSGSSAASGSPIVIGGTGPISSPVLAQPERQAAEQAAISAINASGGINGHPLELKYCDTRNDANGELSCMRTLVSDGVSAIVCPGLIVDQSGRGYTVASAARIPVVGGEGLTPTEFATDGSFPLSSGIPGWAYGSVAALLQKGAKRIAFFGTNEPGSEYIIGLSEEALKSAHVTPVRAVAVDPSTDPTFASGAAKVIAGGVDGIIFDSAPTYAPNGITALRAAGYKGLISSITPLFSPATLKALGAQANGVLLTSQLAFTADTSNAGVSEFLAQMQKYQPNAEIDENSESAWAAVQLFADVAKGLPDVSHTTVWNALGGLSKPVDINVAGPYQVTGATVYLKGYPRIYNPTVQNGVVQNGNVESNGQGFLNPFTTLSNYATGG